MIGVIIRYLSSSIPLGVPLLYGSTGEIITEKSGHLNLGIPGIMYVGSISGVMREFNAKARRYALAKCDIKRLSVFGWALRGLCASGMYPAVYPLSFPFELAQRKMREVAFARRMRRS